ncbi:hypothetical protein [Candidatus Accumulibacter sp. ACC012]|uniref:hypothetical protein n=1 Tax=Candidatus Accumulibacter sp. ACC012 TaxID=2823332 RepID=UPI0025BBE82F|nr:hypothetical protein [Candidatus Accumulibacter sp. ACC012]
MVFKHTGAAPLPLVPLKGEYSVRDFRARARFIGMPYTHPRIPLAIAARRRAPLWLPQDQDCERHAKLRAISHRRFCVPFMALVETFLSRCGA